MQSRRVAGAAGRAVAIRAGVSHLTAYERRIIVVLENRVPALRRQRNTEAPAAGLPKVTIYVLANAAGITAAVLGEIERGRVNPLLVVLTRIARALGVSVASLRDQSDGETAALDSA